MSIEKKVSLLILLLIALIVTCVYTHAEKIEKKIQSDKQKTILIETVKSEQIVLEKKVEQKSEEQVANPIQSNQAIIETKEEVQEKIKPSKKSKDTEVKEPKVSKNLQEENKPRFEKAEDEILDETKKEEVTEVKEELSQEVPEKPLIKTGKKYKRTGTDKRIEDMSKNAQLLQIKIRDFVKEKPIVFARGSNRLVKTSLSTVDTIVALLKEFPNIKIEVAGHTDAAGARKLNQGISVKRAVLVKSLLIKKGINKKRIKARGYGEDIPLVKNNPSGYSKINRRVEFNIIEE